ncbi:MAG: pyridoxal-phosphate-dependent aminotransferase family protein [Acidobacteriota bacterium]
MSSTTGPIHADAKDAGLPTFPSFHPPARVLLGPGPSTSDPRILEAMSRPLVGHLDPAFLELMNSIQTLLKYVFQTENRLTIPVSGTGSAGMEAAVVNFVEPGQRVLVAENGLFGRRLADTASRCGAEVHTLQVPWGRPVDVDQFQDKIAALRPQLVVVVHAETSTGVLQPLEEISQAAHDADALFLVDAVTSLGGHPVSVDERKIDICYSGTQKCLSCPPGLAPLTVSERAAERLRRRKTKVQSWYLDLSLVEKYWGAERTYHHTAPISMNYALYEALRIVRAEGLERRFRRHQTNHRALVAGIQAMGLQMLVEPAFRLWSLNTIRVPESVAEARVRGGLLERYGIEIGGGLGELKGTVWRVGLMGSSSVSSNVLLLLEALEVLLSEQGFALPPGAGARAAQDVFDQPVE